MSRVENAGADLYYELHGEAHAPTIVFAHGAGGNAASWWQQVPFFLERGFRTLAFDHRGFARSICADNDLSVARFPEDLLAILDAEGIERATLVCQSMGGWTGLPTAIAHPERVDGLVLCGTPGSLWTEAVRRSFAEVGERIHGIGGIVGPGGAALAADYPAREPAMAFLYGQIASMNDVPQTLLDSLSGVRTDPSELADFQTPTLVISGTEDVLFPPDVLSDVAKSIPGAELERFQGAGHSTYFEDPARFNEIVSAFVEKRTGFEP